MTDVDLSPSRFSQETERITALARQVGIDLQYWDIFGTEHTATPEALTSTLTALGFDVTSPDAVQNTITALAARGWRPGVDPVTVLRRSAPFSVPVTLSAPLTEDLHWTLTCEDGTVHVGTLPPGAPAEDGPDGHLRLALRLPESLPDGYHTLQIGGGATGLSDGKTPANRQGMVVVAPAQCWLPSALSAGRRLWGIGCQLYTLRDQNDLGMGDFGHLRGLCTDAIARGASFVGVNPLHALFSTRPQDVSPYSPCSRLFLNPLYIDPRAVEEFTTCDEAKALLSTPEALSQAASARQAALIDAPTVAALKNPVLQALFHHFRETATQGRRNDFARFVDTGGQALHKFALFEVLQARWPDRPWHQWPIAYQDPDSDAVAAIADADAETVLYRKWLQFEADTQLAACASVFSGASDRIGLYRDLAVGANSDGADLWGDRSSYVFGARFGAPPDQLGPLGQDWGMPPFNPLTLRAEAYRPFIAMVRANMRHAGALRIDHAMSLLRLFWIPPGLTARDGLYVHYPFDDLLGILALESHRNRCMVIGEDLGTVPDGFRARMEKEAILSYRVVYFERYDNGLFKRPETYPRLALSCATSHDIATVQGHWSGWDIALRHRLGLAAPDTTPDGEALHRSRDRALLIAALRDQGLDADIPETPTLTDAQKQALSLGLHRLLGRAPSALALINLDDLASEETQVNVPGTVTEYPNWRRRLSLSATEILSRPETVALLQAVSAERN